MTIFYLVVGITVVKFYTKIALYQLNMEFIKNIKGNFILDVTSTYIREHFPFKGYLNLSLVNSPVIVKVHSIDMENVRFKVENIEESDLNAVIDDIIKKLSGETIAATNNFKTLAQKVIRAYDTIPNEFTKIERCTNRNVSLNTNVLSAEEYDHRVLIFFGNYFVIREYDFTAGWGKFSYERKEYFEDKLLKIDPEVTLAINTLNEAKTRAKFKKQILNTTISLPYSAIPPFILFLKKFPLVEDKCYKVGDKIMITDPGYCYRYHTEAFKELNFKNKEYNSCGLSVTGTIFHICKNGNIPMFAINLYDGSQCLISVNGIHPTI